MPTSDHRVENVVTCKIHKIEVGPKMRDANPK